MTPAIMPSKILFISTFPPAKCGIASFTQDLLNAINFNKKNAFIITVCALDKKSNAGLYNFPVSLVMDAHQLDSCIETAHLINQDTSIELICIEHEFGLYGGELGEYLLGFLALLEKPFIIRFHTVLPTPDVKRSKVVEAICLLADKIIVMTKNSARLLKEDYHISTAKIIIIPHGTHTASKENIHDLKQDYGLSNKLVLTTFGLLSPNKGIEKGIMAMKAISSKFPQAMYVVIGNTHPNLLQQEGEKYRNYLQQIIDDYDLQQNVRLVNEYVPTKKLMEYLALTDIYLFTSKDPDQAVSGTFLYAMSAGCPIISNSFVLAKEMLDEETGIILTGSGENELAEQGVLLLENSKLRTQMGHNAFLKTRDTTWTNVAQAHTQLFGGILGTPTVATEVPAGIAR
ncbi:glycosyltransferase [Pseudoflavitalea sp. X16]|uniref:glycosyltransferase n=1 Tax=Paraflavitalea devenefica TaxID=2716334 RepID=UPI001421279B|nr:glycosyltransferase [Paraflavitalea devenefica]NII27021.1 glycosyltransferase [Paraflavitalea devenefica]